MPHVKAGRARALGITSEQRIPQHPDVPTVAESGFAGFEAGRLAKDKRQLARLGVPGQLLFLFRVRFGLYAVLSLIGAVVDWGGLESTFAAETAAT